MCFAQDFNLTMLITLKHTLGHLCMNSEHCTFYPPAKDNTGLAHPLQLRSWSVDSFNGRSTDKLKKDPVEKKYQNLDFFSLQKPYRKDR